MFKPKGKSPVKVNTGVSYDKPAKKVKKLDAEDIADMKKGTYSAKEEAAENKKAKKKGGKK